MKEGFSRFLKIDMNEYGPLKVLENIHTVLEKRFKTTQSTMTLIQHLGMWRSDCHSFTHSVPHS